MLGSIVIAHSHCLKVCGRSIVGLNRCGIIVHWLINVRKKLVVTHSLPFGGLWLAGCWDRTGVDIVAVGLVCTVLMFLWCGSPLDNTLIVLGREFPFIYHFVCVGGVFNEGLFLTQPSQQWLDQVTMWGLPDNNADGTEGTIPYIYLDFGSFSGAWVESFKECIVLSRVSRVSRIYRNKVYFERDCLGKAEVRDGPS